mmetsp:Transcript_7706/g.20450  ORF Transcript_7706/g.20450 Transcript_7706/m.20450 type:complete len:231 (+) Transcript_7706:1355-2047(+)
MSLSLTIQYPMRTRAAARPSPGPRRSPSTQHEPRSDTALPHPPPSGPSVARPRATACSRRVSDPRPGGPRPTPYPREAPAAATPARPMVYQAPSRSATAPRSRTVAVCPDPSGHASPPQKKQCRRRSASARTTDCKRLQRIRSDHSTASYGTNTSATHKHPTPDHPRPRRTIRAPHLRQHRSSATPHPELQHESTDHKPAPAAGAPRPARRRTRPQKSACRRAPRLSTNP